METKNEKQLTLDKRYIRMAGIWAENSYCTRRKVGALIVKNQMILKAITIAKLMRPICMGSDWSSIPNGSKIYSII